MKGVVRDAIPAIVEIDCRVAVLRAGDTTGTGIISVRNNHRVGGLVFHGDETVLGIPMEDARHKT